MRITLVAGEASGDLLAASLIRALKVVLPECRFDGIAGPEMIAAGCEALYPLEKLSVMGFSEVFWRLPELLKIRSQLFRRLRAQPPDLFIGIDAPDFNLALEAKLRRAGVKTVHYVSPSVWAWREERVKKIRNAVDLMLTLFPFEEAFYRRHHVPCRFVGHPLADVIPLDPPTAAARHELDVSSRDTVVALLPGSRFSEVKRLALAFLQAAMWVYRRNNDVRFVMPLATAATLDYAKEVASAFGDLPLTVMLGRSRTAMAAADAVLLASGTATLEAMLLKRPMVVAYRLSPISYAIAKRLLKVPYFSLPNLLAGNRLVDEYKQNEVSADVLGPALMAILADEERTARLHSTFQSIHLDLRRNASAAAASAILELLGNDC